MAGKTNIDLGEPTGAFIGSESHVDKSGTPPRKSPGAQKVKSPPDFFSSGKSEATSYKAAGKPTHWRRGGFVTRGKR